MKRLKLYMSLVDNYTRAIGVVILFLACISAGLAAYWPVALGECYTAITEGNKNALVANLVAFVMALLLCELIGFARRVSTDCMLARQERQLRLLSLIKILRMPVAYHEQALSGECTARMNQGVAGFSQIIKLLCQDIFPAALTTVSVLMAVMYSAPTEFCVAMLLYAFMTTVISYFQIRSQRGIREKILGLKIRLDGEITQELQNFEQIRCCNADQEEAKRMYPDVKMIEKSEIRHHVTMGGYDSFKKILQISVIAVLLGMCFVLGQGGRFDVALSITVIMLFQQLAAPVDAVYRCMDEFSSSMVKVSVVGDTKMIRITRIKIGKFMPVSRLPRCAMPLSFRPMGVYPYHALTTSKSMQTNVFYSQAQLGAEKPLSFAQLWDIIRMQAQFVYMETMWTPCVRRRLLILSCMCHSLLTSFRAA